MSGKERELSILFADVSGSTRLYEKLGDTEALHAVDRCIKRMERSVEGFRGRIVKTIGDEVMAVFESAEDAFHAASDMQQRVTDLPPVSGVKLAIRLGFQHGPVIEEKGDYFGDTVNTAARLAGLAKAGQALTSGETVARLPELLQLSTRDLEQMSVKGKVEGLHVFEVLWHDGDELTTLAPSLRDSAKGGGPRLCLRYAGQVIVLDDKNASLSLGRDAGCELVIRDRRASRNHGKIERRGEKFVLTDVSTNGTYVTFAGEPEFFLRREELVLRGSGRISFAASAASDGADIAEFEHL
ncbi:adenylate/guanylate cyclase domain-containing protein [Azospira restricta]|uniref:adenylate/guanylate cyclase domain-containing protein n=1 Tax=Azospira restricta TaxID=404405 RepID=UPI00193BFEC6|nr:adenylate/guanylate cyclase domain-containing protein [Azospira restricta]